MKLIVCLLWILVTNITGASANENNAVAVSKLGTKISAKHTGKPDSKKDKKKKDKKKKDKKKKEKDKKEKDKKDKKKKKSKLYFPDKSRARFNQNPEVSSTTPVPPVSPQNAGIAPVQGFLLETASSPVNFQERSNENFRWSDNPPPEIETGGNPPAPQANKEGVYLLRSDGPDDLPPQPAIQPAGQPAIQPVGQPAIQPAGQPAIQPAGQDIQPMSEPQPGLAFIRGKEPPALAPGAAPMQPAASNFAFLNGQRVKLPQTTFLEAEEMLNEASAVEK